MSTISAQPDLMMLKGARLLRDSEGVGYIRIPVDEAGLQVFDRKVGKGCTLPLIIRERSDNYGNDFMVSRGYTKAESEFNKTAPEGGRKQTEILGNGKWLQKPETSTAQTDTSGFEQESVKDSNNPDDLPF
jgi:hypothetical protein